MEKIDTNKVSLEIEVSKEKVNEALEDAYKKVVKTVTVPGFRKGKVPRKIMEARFGPELFYNEALEILVDPAYNEAIEEYRLEPITQPEMELVQLEKDKPLIFKVNVEVKPEVELCEYKGITVQQAKKEIAPEDVDKYLDSLRKQHARLVVVEEEEELQEKDLAVLDFEGSIDGEVFEGGKGENYSLEIGSGTFVEGFEKQLIGARTGEEREVKVTFPEEYPREELAGKEACFNVRVKEIKRPRLPDLDDAFVQELSEECSTLEEFRANVEKNLTENLKRRQKFELENKIIEKVAADCKVEVPEVLVEREIDNILMEFEYYLNMQGLTLQQFTQMTEGGLDKLREERRDEAAKKARANLVLDAIIKKEAFEVSDDEIEAKIKEIAERQNVTVDEAREQLAQNGRLDMISRDICYRKAVDLLVENAVVEEVEEAVTSGEQEEEVVEPKNDSPDSDAMPKK